MFFSFDLCVCERQRERKEGPSVCETEREKGGANVCKTLLAVELKGERERKG